MDLQPASGQLPIGAVYRLFCLARLCRENQDIRVWFVNYLGFRLERQIEAVLEALPNEDGIGAFNAERLLRAADRFCRCANNNNAARYQDDDNAPCLITVQWLIDNVGQMDNRLTSFANSPYFNNCVAAIIRRDVHAQQKMLEPRLVNHWPETGFLGRLQVWMNALGDLLTLRKPYTDCRVLILEDVTNNLGESEARNFLLYFLLISLEYNFSTHLIPIEEANEVINNGNGDIFIVFMTPNLRNATEGSPERIAVNMFVDGRERASIAVHVDSDANAVEFPLPCAANVHLGRNFLTETVTDLLYFIVFLHQQELQRRAPRRPRVLNV